MTSEELTLRHEQAEVAHAFNRAQSQDRLRCDLKPARFWSVAKALQWVGYGTAALCLLIVITGGGGILELPVGAAAAFLGAAGGALAERLGPNRLLKGILVREVMTPTCLIVPYCTRLSDLIAKHSFTGRCCCVVTRDGYVLGVLSGEDLVSVNLHRNSYDTVEWHMRPVDWVEAVDISDETVEAMEWLKRYGRSFMPVLDGSRLVGIVWKDRIIEEAMCRRFGGPPVAAMSKARGERSVPLKHYPAVAELVSVSTRGREK